MANKVLVVAATDMENVVQSGLSLLRPARYRPYQASDLPDLTNKVGLIFARGSLALRAVGCHYTHVAIFVGNTIYESIETVGVTEVSLDQFCSCYLHHYDTIAVYEFTTAINVTALQAAFQKYQGRPYETDAVEFIKAGFHANTRSSWTSLFCSELVALVLQDLGLLGPKPLANNYTPDDLANLSGNKIIRQLI